jgi:hypothetical protein
VVAHGAGDRVDTRMRCASGHRREHRQAGGSDAQTCTTQGGSRG